MTIFFILLILLCIYMELSVKINTSNILNKIGLGFIIVGALIKIYAIYNPIAEPNDLIPIGIFLHLISDIHKVHKLRKERQ